MNLAELKAALDAAMAKNGNVLVGHKAAIEALQAEAAAGRDVMKKAMDLINDLAAALNAREEAESRQGGPRGRVGKGLGQTIFEHEDFVAARKSGQGSFELQGRSLLTEYKTDLGTNLMAARRARRFPSRQSACRVSPTTRVGA